jgi:glucose-6-phosphate isomerase
MMMSKSVDLKSWPENNTIVKQRRRVAALSRRADVGTDDTSRERLGLDLTHLFDAPGDPRPIRREDLEALIPEVLRAHADVNAGRSDCKDAGVPMLGWLSLPERITVGQLDRIRELTRSLSSEIDAYVSLGIGGSYLGIEATIAALSHTHFNRLSREERGGAPEIYFLGQNMDPDHFRDTMDLLRGKRIGINCISKSGTTTETAIAFRILRRLLEELHGARARDFIWVTTDAQRGALKQLATRKGYQTFVVPEDVGGRFSVLSEVGLVGISMAGIEIDELVEGFRAMKRRTDGDDFWTNPALVHAAVRTLAWRRGKKIEVVATNSTALYQIGRFMEQLFPESEGHGGQGLWVSPALYSEKLHANGQMVQQGERNILETFLRLGRHNSEVEIPIDPEDGDGLNFLPAAGRPLSFINQLTIDGPAYAHFIGGVPNLTILVPSRSAYALGQLFFLLERSVAVSGTLLGHNPFIQPGVVAYKNAIFALAGKPGFEKERERMAQEVTTRPRVIIE